MYFYFNRKSKAFPESIRNFTKITSEIYLLTCSEGTDSMIVGTGFEAGMI